MPITFKAIRKSLYDAVRATMTEQPNAHCTERTLVGRLAHHLERAGQPWANLHDREPLIVDIEYQRAGTVPKRLNGELRIPDLIVHHRMDPDANLLVLEVKRSAATNPDRQHDLRRVLALTTNEVEVRDSGGSPVDMEGELGGNRIKGYRLGAAVVLHQPGPDWAVEVRWTRHGESATLPDGEPAPCNLPNSRALHRDDSAEIWIETDFPSWPTNARVRLDSIVWP